MCMLGSTNLNRGIANSLTEVCHERHLGQHMGVLRLGCTGYKRETANTIIYVFLDLLVKFKRRLPTVTEA